MAKAAALRTTAFVSAPTELTTTVGLFWIEFWIELWIELFGSSGKAVEFMTVVCESSNCNHQVQFF